MTDTTVSDRAPDEAEGPSFEVDPYEKNWMRFSIVLLLAFLTTVTIAGFSMGFQVAGAEQEVDPRTILDNEPWSEPGLREISPGHYEAYVVAQTWSFAPAALEVPVGSTVDIYLTSADLQHGFKITDTNINMQVVPGQVSKLSFTFDEVGQFPYICTEYCGQAHATMFGMVNVVDAEDASAGADGEDAGADTTSTDADTESEQG